MSEWNFVIAAHAVTWTVFLSYGVYLLRRRARARRRYAESDR